VISRRLEVALVSTILVALAAVEVDVARKLSVTYDERAHVGAGFSAVVHRELWLNPEHPPLVKLLAGASLLAAGGEESVAGFWWGRSHQSDVRREEGQWYYGDLLIFRANDELKLPGQRPGAESVLLAARLPVIVFPILLALVAWAWARERFGPAGGLVSLALVATYPDLLGHGALVTTDVPFAALALAAAFALGRLERRGGIRWLAALALALGLALAAKFTAALLVPTLAALALVAARRPLDSAPASIAHPFGEGPATSRLRGVVIGASITAMVAYLTLSAFYLGAEPLARFHEGVRSVRVFGEEPLPTVCFGLRAGRCWWYFPACLALKVPVGTLALLALAAVATRDRAARGDADDEALVHVPALVILAVTIAVAPGLGARYTIPAMPFLFVSAGRLAPWARGSRARWIPIALALAANVVGVAIDHPFHASSTNALAGDPALAYRSFDESNQDWGQGMKALGEWQRARSLEPLVVISRLPDPEPAQLSSFGVRGELRIDARPVWAPERGKVYAVSAHMVARCRAEALASPGAPMPVLGVERRPSELVGGGYLIFDLR
jgi:hypothetical protein